MGQVSLNEWFGFGFISVRGGDPERWVYVYMYM